MFNEKKIWKALIAQALNEVLQEENTGTKICEDQVVLEIPPDANMGDFGFPMFPFAKIVRKAPPAIAALVIQKLEKTRSGGGVSAAGPYINVKLERTKQAEEVVNAVLHNFDTYCKSKLLNGQRIMVEFSSPNTNKPLHLGHLRNDVLGESIARILSACGATVQKVCIMNDRGIHICKSMLAYTEKFSGNTPQSAAKKSDHFVGECYVAFNDMLKSEEDKPEKERGAALRAQELLRKWEDGDSETKILWQKMNGWAVDGLKETYKRTGISFDKYYFESNTYMRGKEEVQKGLDKNIFYRESDGSVWADLSAENLDKKALLRKDGTSLYITQDFGTAILRYEDWNFDRLIYVVGNEQRYHFMVLFSLLKRLGFSWAKNLYHLSYGMVNLPEGRMKTREGTVVDADDLLDELHTMALEEIKQKEHVQGMDNESETAEKIALGALHYYLLQVTPEKDMQFDPKESLSFNGNTGPYLQYVGARISSILRQQKADDIKCVPVNAKLLTSEAEWDLIKTIADWNEVLEAAAEKLNPSLIGAWLYNLAKKFSVFYKECPILTGECEELCAARLALCKATAAAEKNALEIVCIPFLEAM